MTEIMNDNANKLMTVLRKYGAEHAMIVNEDKAPNGPSIEVYWRKGKAKLIGDRTGPNLFGMTDFGQPRWVVLYPTKWNAAETEMREVELAEARVLTVRMERTSGAARVAAIEEAEAEARELRAKFRHNFGRIGNADYSQRELFWKILDGEVKPQLGRDGLYTVWWRGAGYIVGSDSLEMFAEVEEVGQHRKEVYHFNQGWYPLFEMPGHFPKWSPAARVTQVRCR